LETETTTTVNVTLRRPPIPSFTFTPASPQTGAIVKFTSTSQQGQTAIARYDWDLDGDGQFDDATGPTTQRSFTTAGRYTVSLRTTDSSTPPIPPLTPSASATVVVTDLPSSGGTGTSNPNGTGVTASGNTGNSTVSNGTIGQTLVSIGSLSKAAKVRISGTFKGSVARITRLTVTGPVGMKIRVVCKGKGCSTKQNTYRLAISSKVKAARFVRMRRTLRAGAVIEIYLTKSGSSGKYIKYRFRSGKPPARSISCLAVNSTKPTVCSST
jgi:PKD repeat protein